MTPTHSLLLACSMLCGCAAQRQRQAQIPAHDHYPPRFVAFMRTPANIAPAVQCYTRGLRTPVGNEQGFVVVRFWVSDSGEVLWSDVHDQAATMSVRTARCVADAVLGFHFGDIFENVGQVVYFKFDFVFDLDPIPQWSSQR